MNKKYKIVDKIGNGKFGIVYKGTNVKSNESVAIKAENRNCSIKLLKNETAILKYLYDNGARSIPIVYWYGVDNNYSYLVMSYYEISLFDYCNNKTISSEKVDKIMHVCIDIIETIHKNFVIHRDIKPQNFMISNEELFVIDFGFSTFFIGDKGEHLPNTGSLTIVGTAKYISHNLHDGWSPSRRDDLISLGYLYIYLCYRELPWDSLQSQSSNNDYDEIHILHFKNQQRKKLKAWENLEKICAKCNSKIHSFLNYCYQLKYDGLPNYIALKELFTTQC